MSATPGLTDALRRQVTTLEEDLRVRASLPETDSDWRAIHAEAVTSGRTAGSYVEWRDDRVTQAAVAWVLVSVFVRFCEDNALVRPVWITGPGQRRQEALDGQAAFFRAHPDDTDREWLQQAIHYLAGLPATAGLVDEHSALWLLTPSGDAISTLLAFWRETDESGQLHWDLADPQWDSRFLGDCYQDLSESARERYALLQTPIFVEEFILDRTLEPALADRPLEGFRLIDPTCGSGHFLLGAFYRLLDRWNRHAPAMDRRERVQAALDAIHGVDLNPYAVAIARFRLTLAALRASRLDRLEDAPAFDYHLAVGDSLLHGASQQALDLGIEFDTEVTLSGFGYATEDLALLREILQVGRYDCVVGNPPYITVKDKALNRAYRQRYTTCSGKYALTVPFMERFFGLAKTGDQAGWVGQITSNSFMKREFGAKLIEQFLTKQDLRLVVDTSCAFIPGHATPTLIVVGRKSPPIARTLRAVLGIRGEQGEPKDPPNAVVWRAIADHVDESGWTDEWVTVADLDRSLLATHPWSLVGGGAVELQQAIESAASRRLSSIAESIGITSFTLEDDVFVAEATAFRTRGLPQPWLREMVLGDSLRDWASSGHPLSIFPYDEHLLLSDIETAIGVLRWMWPYKTNLSNNIMFGGQTKVACGLRWYEYGRMTASKLRTPLSIAFAEVATHNHFVFDRGAKVFKQTAPVIKLGDATSEEDHLGLLGVLNTSTICFWLQQVCYDKGTGGNGRGVATELWEHQRAFNGTNVGDIPLSAFLPVDRSRRLDALAHQLIAVRPPAITSAGLLSRNNLDEARLEYACIRARMVTEQEELDWECYRDYGLIDEDLTYGGDDLPGLALGERAFEIVLARRVAAGEEQTAWFARHGSTPITEIPPAWPPRYRSLVARRIELIESHSYLRLLERPEHKRRWAADSWEKQEEHALRVWLLDRLEDRGFWFDTQGRPQARSVAQLADEVAREADLVAVLELWEGRPDVAVTESLVRLLDGEAVPFLAAYRYKESGLGKRAEWELTWALQRREDAGEQLGPIPVPPKYTTADFAKTAYWSHRGKLDVPKERFVLYPNAGRDTDPTAVLGWAGWDHAEQALALARLLQEREADGWTDDRLVPLLAGLAELQPWLDQWHNQPQPPLFAAASPADYFREQLTRRAQQAGRTLDQLAAWRPDPPTRGRRRKGD